MRVSALASDRFGFFFLCAIISHRFAVSRGKSKIADFVSLCSFFLCLMITPLLEGKRRYVVGMLGKEMDAWGGWMEWRMGKRGVAR